MLRDDLLPHELMQHVGEWFESQSIEYWVVGSMASMAYGEPRFTNDVDIVARLRPDCIDALLIAFPVCLPNCYSKRRFRYRKLSLRFSTPKVFIAMNSNPYAPPTRKVKAKGGKKSWRDVWKWCAIGSAISILTSILLLVAFEAAFKASVEEPWYKIVDGLIALLILLSFVMICLFGILWVASPKSNKG